MMLVAARRLTDWSSMPLLVAYLAGGVASLIADVPTSVERALGPRMEIVWAIMLIVGPALILIGTLDRDRWRGTWIRIAVGPAVILGHDLRIARRSAVLAGEL